MGEEGSWSLGWGGIGFRRAGSFRVFLWGDERV